jgi:hypothetical protein
MHSRHKAVLTLVLTITLATTACTAQWIAVALQDLPVLTQMALNLATLVSTLSNGKQATTTDTAIIQNISAQASRDLNLLQSLYNEYKSTSDPNTLQKISNVIDDLNQHLPALLESAHISNVALSARVTVAVKLILTTVNSFAALMPQTRASTMAVHTLSVPQSPPTPKDLKQQWNQQVCASSGNAQFDRVLSDCMLR